MDKIKVLFLCIHNSARSQMAEAYLKKFGGEHFAPESAGLEPGVLNPLAVQVMKEDGIDISNNPTKEVFDLVKLGKSFFYVITVCDAKSSDRCPIFPGLHKMINWDFEDPSTITGSEEDRLSQTRIIRDKIKEAVKEFIKEVTG
ncbi:MAG: Glutaredoxin arsenate reductase [Bacteroidota bacterium]|nr:Glutaredoxin arsenate reductase [Bacteroidota bacterium]